MTWQQFERVAKFGAGLVWGTLELWLWGGRPYPLMFIGMVWGLTEAARAWGQIRSLERKPNGNGGTP